jgi:hypothetical protein
MGRSKTGAVFTTMVSASFPQTDEQCVYEIPFRRWLVRELEEGRLTVPQAIERFNFSPSSGRHLIFDWRRKYAPSMVLPLADMTEQEKQKLAALQKQVKELGQQLEEARMRNIALDTLIDVAEEKLKISIRKKSGAKQ